MRIPPGVDEPALKLLAKLLKQSKKLTSIELSLDHFPFPSHDDDSSYYGVRSWEDNLSHDLCHLCRCLHRGQDARMLGRILFRHSKSLLGRNASGSPEDWSKPIGYRPQIRSS